MSASSTLAPKTLSGLASEHGESRVCFRATRDLYETLSHALEDQHILMVFDGESIQLISPGIYHERFKTRIHDLIIFLADLFDLPSSACGSTTWKKREAERALEADEAFYLTAEKVARAAEPQKEGEVPAYPDLAVEIDLSRIKVDRPSIHAVQGVTEVWRLVRDTFVIELLDEQGRYLTVPASHFLRITTEELDHWILGQPLASDRDFRRDFTAWARERFGHGE